MAAHCSPVSSKTQVGWYKCSMDLLTRTLIGINFNFNYWSNITTCLSRSYLLLYCLKKVGIKMERAVLTFSTNIRYFPARAARVLYVPLVKSLFYKGLYQKRHKALLFSKLLYIIYVTLCLCYIESLELLMPLCLRIS